MSNFADFLKSLNIDVEAVSSNSYVYFDKENGKINRITNRKETDEVYAVLEVAHESVSDIITGLKSTDSFLVDYDVSLKQLALKEITYIDHLSKIDSRMHRLPVVRTSTDALGDKGSMIFDSIYDGVDVYFWIKDQPYPKGSIIWYNDTVYKVLEDLPSSKTFDDSKVEIFVDNVIITDVKSMNHLVEYKSKFQPIYEGIKVDVWYQELEHLPGQHVWIQNAVYRIKEYQAANTSFTLGNADLIESNVFLYNDSNTSLSFVSVLSFGDKILDNNQLYLFTDEKVDFKQTQKSIIFHTSKYDGLLLDESTNEFTKFSFIEKENKVKAEYSKLYDKVVVNNVDHLSNGRKVLIGKRLYLTNRLNERDYDVNVVQNNLIGCWEIYLGRKTKKSLETVSYIGQDILYFSVTAKHDPNVVYRTMEFSLSNLLKNKSEKYPYQHEWELNREDVSVYTSKFFETYSHEILE